MKIGTHNGVFHADDVFAVAVLLLIYPEARVLRTRDQKELDQCDFVVDVGAVYKHSTGRFDHHQKDRAGARENGVLYSSFGLVWKHYGAACLQVLNIYGLGVWEIVDQQLVQPVDATDNGQALFEGGKAVFDGISPFSVSAVLSGFNPAWWETHKKFDEYFMKAVGMAQQILRNVANAAEGVIRAESLVGVAIENAKKSEEPRLVIMDQFCPWAEQVRDQAPEALFVVFPSETGTWMVQAVNKTAGTFESRKLLPEAWAGLRDQAFRDATGVHDGVFCHPGRFICGAASRESALKLAQMAINS